MPTKHTQGTVVKTTQHPRAIVLKMPDNSIITEQVDHRCAIQRNGKIVLLEDLQVGDSIKMSGDPTANSIVATH